MRLCGFGMPPPAPELEPIDTDRNGRVEQWRRMRWSGSDPLSRRLEEVPIPLIDAPGTGQQ